MKKRTWGFVARGMRAFMVLSAFAATSVVTSAAHAVTECVPGAVGVPGLSGPPVWTGTGSWATIDDPRWNGAVRDGFPNIVSMANDATARVLQDGSSLYMTLQALVDPDGYTTTGSGATLVNWDRVFIGFRNPTTSAVQLLEVEATAAAAGDTWATHVEKTWSRPNGT